jgi:hypothetical protein
MKSKSGRKTQKSIKTGTKTGNIKKIDQYDVGNR